MKRKLIHQMMISVDGYFEGPDKNIDWHTADKEFDKYAINFLDNLDVLIFGRTTYELMASYWPTASALKDDPIVAEKMNKLRKVVVSETLEKAEWNNTELIKTNVAEKIGKLKDQPGKDMAIFGSSDLSLTLIPHRLIDEYRIFISPVLLGNGNSLFKGLQEKQQLKLIKAETFNSGNVLLYYEPKI